MGSEKKHCLKRKITVYEIEWSISCQFDTKPLLSIRLQFQRWNEWENPKRKSKCTYCSCITESLINFPSINSEKSRDQFITFDRKSICILQHHCFVWLIRPLWKCRATILNDHLVINEAKQFLTLLLFVYFLLNILILKFNALDSKCTFRVCI